MATDDAHIFIIYIFIVYIFIVYIYIYYIYIYLLYIYMLYRYGIPYDIPHMDLNAISWHTKIYLHWLTYRYILLIDALIDQILYSTS